MVRTQIPIAPIKIKASCFCHSSPTSERWITLAFSSLCSVEAISLPASLICIIAIFISSSDEFQEGICLCLQRCDLLFCENHTTFSPCFQIQHDTRLLFHHVSLEEGQQFRQFLTAFRSSHLTTSTSQGNLLPIDDCWGLVVASHQRTLSL